MKDAFLFDIDGCLTLPEHDRSVLDHHLINHLYDLSKTYHIAFITGRSLNWLGLQYANFGSDHFLDIPTYIEFGLAKIVNREPELSTQIGNFEVLRSKLIDELWHHCQRENVFFERTAYTDYPDHGSLWLEDKLVQVSIATNECIDLEEVYELCEVAWKDYMEDIRYLRHHLGIDVIPAGWSKEKATYDFIESLRENEEQYFWHVFGDNISDREMCRGLTNVRFVSTRDAASNTVRVELDKLDLGLEGGDYYS